MTNVACKIDWITATLREFNRVILNEVSSYTAALLAARSICSSLGINEPELCSTQISRHYDYSFVERNTRLAIDISRAGRAQGHRVVLSGRSLSNFESGEHVVRMLIGGGWKLTRIDAAVDVVDYHETITEIADTWRQLHGELKPYASKHDVRRNGEMFTIGSRQSSRYLRIYDKAKEQRVDMRWLRCELEIKHDLAARCADIAARSAAELMQLALPLLALPNSEVYQGIQALESSTTPDVAIAPRPRTNTRLWFEHSVIPCLAKLKQSDPVEYREIVQLLVEEFTEHDESNLVEAS